MKPKIAFLGTGIMGCRMAANLLKAGFPVAVWNRSVSKSSALVAQGAVVAETPPTAVAGAEVVFTMLADGPVVEAVLFDAVGTDTAVVDALAPGALVIDCSSIDPATARDHGARLAERGVDYLDAPVSGGPSGAEQASLAIMVGGSHEAFARGEEILTHLGRPTHVGGIGAGQTAKLANQIIVALAIGAVAEGLLLAAAGGADPVAVRQAMTGGLADSLVLQIHGGRMIERRFLPGGPTRMHLKDLKNILATAKDVNLELPLTRQIHDLFESLAKAGGGDYDHSAILLEIERRNAPARLNDREDILPG